MRKPITYLNQYIQGKIMTYHIRHDGSIYYKNRLKTYSGKEILDVDSTNNRIAEMIRSGRPMMVCRFGSTELATMKIFDFEVEKKYAEQMARVHTLSGLFPETTETGKKFTELMLGCIPSADLIGIWPQAFEEYYLQEYGSDSLKCTWLESLEPWNNPQNPWSAALAGKKVLVVHPFIDSIEAQYQKREQIFQNTNILPEFELQTLRSVQTAGGGADERFSSWFEAYEWMKEEILKRDFDIAILGCGAYGFPLAAAIKAAGKQAVHFGGVTQILFGILGARWDGDEDLKKFVNASWVRPMDKEKPKNASAVENNCYW